MRFHIRIYFIPVFAFTCFSSACSSPPDHSQEKTTEQHSTVPVKRVPIDSSGFTIELPATMKITNQKGA
ncbi:MAG TPA: hypothetical protein VFJ43_00400, partial [Bacteroidia bacterium]|nr:hypothetical protein [Bacteroidia bacterium]